MQHVTALFELNRFPALHAVYAVHRWSCKRLLHLKDSWHTMEVKFIPSAANQPVYFIVINEKAHPLGSRNHQGWLYQNHPTKHQEIYWTWGIFFLKYIQFQFPGWKQSIVWVSLSVLLESISKFTNFHTDEISNIPIVSFVCIVATRFLISLLFRMASIQVKASSKLNLEYKHIHKDSLYNCYYFFHKTLHLLLGVILQKPWGNRSKWPQ